MALIGAISVYGGGGVVFADALEVGNYNALRHDQETLKKQYQQLPKPP